MNRAFLRERLRRLERRRPPEPVEIQIMYTDRITGAQTRGRRYRVSNGQVQLSEEAEDAE